MYDIKNKFSRKNRWNFLYQIHFHWYKCRYQDFSGLKIDFFDSRPKLWPWSKTIVSKRFFFWKLSLTTVQFFFQNACQTNDITFLNSTYYHVVYIYKLQIKIYFSGRFHETRKDIFKFDMAKLFLGLWWWNNVHFDINTIYFFYSKIR